MYLSHSIIDGLKILSFDKETIKKVSKEKSLEEIFLSTLFLNYIIVLIIFFLTSLFGNISIYGKELNMPVFFGLLMVYPFLYNLKIYFLYGLFGLFGELLNSRNKVKPLILVGFHTAIVYTIIIYVIAILTTINLHYGLFLFGIFFLYFLLTMFLSVKTIYNFSNIQSFIIILIPLLFFSLIFLISLMFVDLRFIFEFFLN